MAPEVVDWSERHMRLSWNEPIDDGGAPITGYHVEAKAKTDEEWQVYYKLLRHYPHSMTAANNKLVSLYQLWDTVDTNRTTADMQKLQKGKEYQFRIIAINKAGKSEHSSASRFKEAKARNRESDR